MEGMWDGFGRINTETKKGGIVGIFRHGAIETKRILTVNYLDPAGIYQVKTMDGKVFATLTGNELTKTGFVVNLEEKYSGELFEICAK
jgi:alpha-galactosidase